MSLPLLSPRDLPKVDGLLRSAKIAPLVEAKGRQTVRGAIRRALDDIRSQLLKNPSGDSPDTPLTVDDLIRNIQTLIEEDTSRRIRRVINATGAILHSNLGRAPLSDNAAKAAYEAARAYSSLEYDLNQGERGERIASVERLLCGLSGTESALVVNNNAAAVILILAALARGREVVVSRGELVEIGGSFRVPEIMEESGAILREAGTTNKTHPSDYIHAIGEDTAALLKVNQSNFKISGFTTDVPSKQLAVIAHEHDLPLIYDLGSGCLSPELGAMLKDEITVQEAAASGADVVCFSGDKLLGGPQSGLIVGSERFLAPMRNHPLYRAFRCGKMTLAALESTLMTYKDSARAVRDIPFLSMALADEHMLLERVSHFTKNLISAGIHTETVNSASIVGCGSAPGFEMPSPVIALRPDKAPRARAAEQAARLLRKENPPVICRTAHNALFFDLRTVSEEEENLLFRSIVRVFKEDR